MNSDAPSYHGYRFPADLIAHAVWLYYRFSLSFRDVEDLLAQRGITVTSETIRQWCRTFGQAYARRRRGQMGATWHLDELFVTINGRLRSTYGAPWTRTVTCSTSRWSRASGAVDVSVIGSRLHAWWIRRDSRQKSSVRDLW
jgi:putative transposase